MKNTEWELKPKHMPASPNEKINEVIEWILNIQPLVNNDYKDELAERVGYIFDKSYDMYVKKD